MSYFKEFLNRFHTTNYRNWQELWSILKGDIEPPTVEEIESAFECRKMSKAPGRTSPLNSSNQEAHKPWELSIIWFSPFVPTKRFRKSGEKVWCALSMKKVPSWHVTTTESSMKFASLLEFSCFATLKASGRHFWSLKKECCGVRGWNLLVVESSDP